MDDTLMTKIDDIYTSHNIYKAIFITNTINIDILYNELDAKDYPVCKEKDVHKFNSYDYRILLLDFDTYHNVKSLINFSNITTVIYIGVFEQIDDIPNIDQIFL